MLRLFSNRVKSFSKDDKGASMIEYALVVGLIALVAIVGVTTFGTNLNTLFATEAGKISSTNTTAGK
jgi:pilus assembly protein Flp/PilA